MKRSSGSGATKRPSAKKVIGERIRALRIRRGLTQIELARLLGANQANLSKIETGERGVALRQVLKLATALQVSTDEILNDAKAPKAPGSLRSGRLLRCLQQIEELPATDQRAVLRLLEGVLARHQLQQQAQATAKRSQVA